MVLAGTLQGGERTTIEASCVATPRPAPRVSLGVPVYNGERYLADALDSLLAQTFTDFEIVISDNASTDGTEAIGRRYAAQDPRVRYFRANENRGLAWNFGRAFELSRGEYFKWAAYDDLCEPTYVERCVDLLDQCSDVVWCHSSTAFIDGSGKRLPGVADLAFLDHGPKTSNASAAGDLRSCSRSSAHPHQRLLAVATGPGEVYDMYGLMRSSALKRTGLHRPFYGGDRVLIAELSLLGRYAEVPEPLFLARRHPEQSVFTPVATIERTTSGRPAQRRFLPRRLRGAAWLLRLILQADLSFAERLRCLGAFAYFAANPRKWKRLGIDVLRTVGIRIAVPEDAVRQAAFTSANGNDAANSVAAGNPG